MILHILAALVMALAVWVAGLTDPQRSFVFAGYLVAVGLIAWDADRDLKRAHDLLRRFIEMNE